MTRQRRVHASPSRGARWGGRQSESSMRTTDGVTPVRWAAAKWDPTDYHIRVAMETRNGGRCSLGVHSLHVAMAMRHVEACTRQGNRYVRNSMANLTTWIRHLSSFGHAATFILGHVNKWSLLDQLRPRIATRLGTRSSVQPDRGTRR